MSKSLEKAINLIGPNDEDSGIKELTAWGDGCGCCEDSEVITMDNVDDYIEYFNQQIQRLKNFKKEN